MRSAQYLKNVVTLELGQSECIGCGMCVEVCPHGVFGLDDGRAVILDRDACMECGACSTNCPAGAISVRAGVGCAAALLSGGVCCGERGSECCEPSSKKCR